jgi:hypothetical protein
MISRGTTFHNIGCYFEIVNQIVYRYLGAPDTSERETSSNSGLFPRLYQMRLSKVNISFNWQISLPLATSIYSHAILISWYSYRLCVEVRIPPPVRLTSIRTTRVMDVTAQEGINKATWQYVLRSCRVRANALLAKKACSSTAAESMGRLLRGVGSLMISCIRAIAVCQ